MDSELKQKIHKAEELQEQIQNGASISDIVDYLDKLLNTRQADGWISVKDVMARLNEIAKQENDLKSLAKFMSFQEDLKNMLPKAPTKENNNG